MKNKHLLGSEKLEKQTVAFFEYVPPTRFSRGLRNMLVDYLSLQADGNRAFMDDLLIDIQLLFDLLDVAADEIDAG